MISAKETFLKLLNEGFQKYHPDDELVIEDKYTQIMDYGWIFIVQSNKYLETGDMKYLVAGNARIVLKNGMIEGLVSYLPLEQAVAKFEESRKSD